MFWILFITIVLILSYAGDEKTFPPKITYFFRGLLVIVLSYVVSFGSAISTDHNAYVYAYHDSIGMRLSDLNVLSFGRSVTGLGYEPGYMTLSIIGNNLKLGFPGFLFCILGFVNSVYVVFAYKHKYPVLTIFLFVLSNIFILETNLVRQSLAMAIVFISYSFIERGRFIHGLLLILLGVTFHISAIVLLPVSFFALYNFSEHKKTICNLALALWVVSLVVAMSGINIKLDFMFFRGDSFDYYEKYFSNSNDTGMESTFDFILNCIAIFILFSLRKKYSVYSILLMIGVVLSNVSVAIPNIGRLALYFTVLAPLFYSTILTELPKNVMTWGNVFLCFIVLNSIRLLIFTHILDSGRGLGSVMYPLSAFFVN